MSQRETPAPGTPKYSHSAPSSREFHPTSPDEAAEIDASHAAPDLLFQQRCADLVDCVLLLPISIHSQRGNDAGASSAYTNSHDGLLRFDRASAPIKPRGAAIDLESIVRSARKRHLDQTYASLFSPDTPIATSLAAVRDIRPEYGHIERVTILETRTEERSGLSIDAFAIPDPVAPSQSIHPNPHPPDTLSITSRPSCLMLNQATTTFLPHGLNGSTNLELSPVESGSAPRITWCDGVLMDEQDLQDGQYAADGQMRVYDCLWDMTPCTLSVGGDRLRMARHLQVWHDVRAGDGGQMTCLWDKCGKRVNKKSIARHITNVHLGLRSIRTTCGNNTSPNDTWQRHRDLKTEAYSHIRKPGRHWYFQTDLISRHK
ncbi:hypothetical protein BV22DRAFT_1134185 [Leucogyrophana mollusca]|uniref:Uncharacterized protein n=1 Tax=Leucogyrophana mollusca TaxID=85980 RepID=A0ACB8B098_9AGAM|nr:hypothetical protein BV22DRAFT_1134185 [Leucogyrophana mollusca]